MVSTTPITPAVLSAAQAAKYLGIDQRTLERLHASSAIEYVRLSPRRRGFTVKALDEYLASRTVPARKTGAA